MRKKEGMEIALVPQRATRASPVFAASVVVAAGASDISEVGVIAQRSVADGARSGTFGTYNSVIVKVPACGRGPGFICVPPEI